MGKIWANSGDSHLVEPADLFSSTMPPIWRSGCRAASRILTASGRPSTSTVRSSVAGCPARPLWTRRRASRWTRRLPVPTTPTFV